MKELNFIEQEFILWDFSTNDEYGEESNPDSCFPPDYTHQELLQLRAENESKKIIAMNRRK